MDRREREEVFRSLPDIFDSGALGPLNDYWFEAIGMSEGFRGLGLPKHLAIPYYSCLRLMLAMDERRDHLRIPGYRFTAYGFLFDSEEKPDFGVQHYAALREDGSEEENSVPLDPIFVANRWYPVVVRRVRESLHAPSIHPQWGTAACWATSRKSSSTLHGPGVVTAKHVITHNVGSSPAIGGQIDLSDGSKGTILDLGPDGIDAGLISTLEPPGTTALSMQKHLAPNMDVTFEGAASWAHSTWVTQITDVRGVMSSLLPARATLAEAGLGGDSGALVWDSNHNTVGVGFYIGALRDRAGRSEGIAQNGYQVEQLMDMEFYL